VAHWARAGQPCHACTTVPNPAGTDMKAVVITCHGVRIGSRNQPRKTVNRGVAA
jgi:hypothetical protein